jgi:hypothetical protein
MPKLSIMFARAALIWLLLGSALGVATSIGLLPASAFYAATLHALMVGWITMLIAGVAIWMFPNRKREQRFTSGWVSLICWNVGLLARVSAEPARMLWPDEAVWGATLVASALCQLAGALALAATLLPRLKR